MRRYYHILGISPKASAEEIREAWLFSLKAFHPDKFAMSSARQRATAETRTKAINEAYEVLSDAVRRSVFDRDYAQQFARQHPRHSAQPAPPPRAPSPPPQRAAPPRAPAQPDTPSSRFSLAGRLTAGAAFVVLIVLLAVFKAPTKNRLALPINSRFTPAVTSPS